MSPRVSDALCGIGAIFSTLLLAVLFGAVTIYGLRELWRSGDILIRRDWMRTEGKDIQVQREWIQSVNMSRGSSLPVPHMLIVLGGRQLPVRGSLTQPGWFSPACGPAYSAPDGLGTIYVYSSWHPAIEHVLRLVVGIPMLLGIAWVARQVLRNPGATKLQFGRSPHRGGMLHLQTSKPPLISLRKS